MTKDSDSSEAQRMSSDGAGDSDSAPPEVADPVLSAKQSSSAPPAGGHRPQMGPRTSEEDYYAIDVPGLSIDPESSDFRIGYFVGLLVGEGHLGGDGLQPQLTLRMHTVHEQVFRWLQRNFPGGRLFGPYEHAGRRYFQWMARGKYLRHRIVPILDQVITSDLDIKTFQRLKAMKDRYGM